MRIYKTFIHNTHISYLLFEEYKKKIFKLNKFSLHQSVVYAYAGGWNMIIKIIVFVLGWKFGTHSEWQSIAYIEGGYEIRQSRLRMHIKYDSRHVHWTVWIPINTSHKSIFPAVLVSSR